ncbi:hypothetical protein PHMEG_00030313 [Phytophthora megakarya]|uniref:Uncharacterized protein n=1 Tax=Phytophthora megakarya TaxID=4795 RepID=A0A225V063_9STRA|nr:hypothetical protein PHMEG_00030313 [Phytophthora megakarya]
MRHECATEERWCSTRKLVSILGAEEPISRRKTPPAAVLRRLCSGWIGPHHTIDDTRIRLYNSYVLPVLLYNCGTWAFTTTQLHHLESFHRRQVRSVLSVKYLRVLTTLYEICNKRPLRHRTLATSCADQGLRPDEALFRHVNRR